MLMELKGIMSLTEMVSSQIAVKIISVTIQKVMMIPTIIILTQMAIIGMIAALMEFARVRTITYLRIQTEQKEMMYGTKMKEQMEMVN